MNNDELSVVLLLNMGMFLLFISKLVRNKVAIIILSLAGYSFTCLASVFGFDISSGISGTLLAWNTMNILFISFLIVVNANAKNGIFNRAFIQEKLDIKIHPASAQISESFSG